MNGLTVDRQTITPEANGGVDGVLTVAPTTAGVARVQVVVSSAAARAVVDGAIDVEAVRWRVVSYDPRPSWASTLGLRFD